MCRYKCKVCFISNSSHLPLTSSSSLSGGDSESVQDESPVSSKAEGAVAGLCPRIPSSSLKNMHDCLPLPVLPLLSLTSLYFVFKFFTFARHYFQSRSYPCSWSFFAIRSKIALLRTAPSSSSCILLSPQIARRALTSLSAQTVPRFVSAVAIA